jgi:hypothetical protein
MVVPNTPKIPEPMMPPFEFENEREEPLAIYIIYAVFVM